MLSFLFAFSCFAVLRLALFSALLALTVLRCPSFIAISTLDSSHVCHMLSAHRGFPLDHVVHVVSLPCSYWLSQRRMYWESFAGIFGYSRSLRSRKSSCVTRLTFVRCVVVYAKRRRHSEILCCPLVGIGEWQVSR